MINGISFSVGSLRSIFNVLFQRKKSHAKPNGNLPLMYPPYSEWRKQIFSCKLDIKNNRASGKSIKAHRINHTVDKIRVYENRCYQKLMGGKAK